MTMHTITLLGFKLCINQGDQCWLQGLLLPSVHKHIPENYVELWTQQRAPLPEHMILVSVYVLHGCHV